mmetsp:Transcript_5297/g.7266  ORF Transcript_5297/g.7266 Transcript_5297/m.7266 type:complete len:104 (+) Transcript_5297:273-584(+)
MKLITLMVILGLEDCMIELYPVRMEILSVECRLQIWKKQAVVPVDVASFAWHHSVGFGDAVFIDDTRLESSTMAKYKLPTIFPKKRNMKNAGLIYVPALLGSR